jgi:hypothetical protein
MRGGKSSLMRLWLNILLLLLPLAPLEGVADSYPGVSVFLGCDAASVGIWFPTFRDSVVASSYRVDRCKKATLSRNVWNQRPSDANVASQKNWYLIHTTAKTYKTGSVPTKATMRTFVQPLFQWKSNEYYIYWVAFVALVVQHAMRMLRMGICGLSRCTLFFHIVS